MNEISITLPEIKLAAQEIVLPLAYDLMAYSDSVYPAGRVKLTIDDSGKCVNVDVELDAIDFDKYCLEELNGKPLALQRS